MAARLDSATRRLLGAGWIHGARFDLVFLLAVPALALAGGALASFDRRLLLPVLLVALALLTAAFYIVPAWGILGRCAQAPESFVGLDLRLMSAPQPMVQ